MESYRRPCVSCSLGRTHIPTALLLVSRCVSKCARIGGFTAVNWSFYDPLLSKLGLFSSRLEIIYGFYREKMLIFPFTTGLKNSYIFPLTFSLWKILYRHGYSSWYQESLFLTVRIENQNRSFVFGRSYSSTIFFRDLLTFSGIGLALLFFVPSL